MPTVSSSWRSSISSAGGSISLDEKLETLSQWRCFEPQVRNDSVKVLTAYAKGRRDFIHCFAAVHNTLQMNRKMAAVFGRSI